MARVQQFARYARGVARNARSAFAISALAASCSTEPPSSTDRKDNADASRGDADASIGPSVDADSRGPDASLDGTIPVPDTSDPKLDAERDTPDATGTADGKSDATTPGDARPDGCANGELSCAGTCRAANDIRACGSCANDCTRLPNVRLDVLACVAGRCSYVCAPGHGDCGDAGAGCATDLSTRSDCGGCGTTCAGATPLCAAADDAGATSSCSSTCPSSSPTDCSGSCVDTATHPAHCGWCDHRCTTAVPGAGAICQAGMCGFRCLPGFQACNGGCFDFASDPNHCGGCDASHACRPNELCRNGACFCPSQCSGTCINLQTDPNHCGVCDHGCQGGACAGGACQPVTLASQQGLPWDIALDATHVYWTNPQGGSVMKIPKTGGQAVPIAMGQNSPYHLVLDATDVYWTEGSFGTVFKAPKSGGTPVKLASGGENFQDIAIDATNLYWSDAAKAGKIMMMPLSGGTPVALAEMETYAFALATTATDVYWGKYSGGRNVIMKARPGGGSPVEVASTSAQTGPPWALVADAESIYWTELSPGRIAKAPLGGGTSAVLLTQGFLRGLALDATTLFWTDQEASAIMAMPKGGGTPAVLASGQAGPMAVATDATTIYWLNAGAVNAANGSVMRLAR
jgi:hypothetical protein